MEESEGQLPPPPGVRTMGIPMLSITAEFLMILGILFIILGAGAFVTDFLKIKGSGEFLIGLFLVIVGAVLMARTMKNIRIVKSQPVARATIRKEELPDRSPGAYR